MLYLQCAHGSENLGPRLQKVQPGQLPAGPGGQQASVLVPAVQRRASKLFGRSVRVAIDEDTAGSRAEAVSSEDNPNHGHDHCQIQNVN